MVNKKNIDTSLLKIVENINENSANSLLNESILKKDKISKVNSTVCIAAVPYATKSLAYNDIQKGNIDVYMLKENIKGVWKIKAYSRCSKKQQEGCDYCHIHKKASENNKSEEFKIFEKDIMPKDISDINKYKAVITDEYFDSMGKRGAKKKNVSYNFIFNSENNPILMILKHPNAKLMTSLEMFANQLLKTNAPISNITLTPIESNSVSTLLETISKNDKKSTGLKKTKGIKETEETKKFEETKESEEVEEVGESEESEEVGESEESEEVEEVEESEDLKEVEEVEESEDLKEVEESEDLNDIEDDTKSVASDASSSIECIALKTIKGKEIFLEPDSNNVYDNDGEDTEYTLLGTFTKIDEKYGTIKYDDEYYTVMKDHDHNKYCVFTNRVYNYDNKHIGSLKKTKSGDIKYYPK